MTENLHRCRLPLTLTRTKCRSRTLLTPYEKFLQRKQQAIKCPSVCTATLFLQKVPEASCSQTFHGLFRLSSSWCFSRCSSASRRSTVRCFHCSPLSCQQSGHAASGRTAT